MISPDLQRHINDTKEKICGLLPQSIFDYPYSKDTTLTEIECFVSDIFKETFKNIPLESKRIILIRSVVKNNINLLKDFVAKEGNELLRGERDVDSMFTFIPVLITAFERYELALTIIRLAGNLTAKHFPQFAIDRFYNNANAEVLCLINNRVPISSPAVKSKDGEEALELARKAHNCVLFIFGHQTGCFEASRDVLFVIANYVADLTIFKTPSWLDWDGIKPGTNWYGFTPDEEGLGDWLCNTSLPVVDVNQLLRSGVDLETSKFEGKPPLKFTFKCAVQVVLKQIEFLKRNPTEDNLHSLYYPAGKMQDRLLTMLTNIDNLHTENMPAPPILSRRSYATKSDQKFWLGAIIHLLYEQKQITEYGRHGGNWWVKL